MSGTKYDSGKSAYSLLPHNTLAWLQYTRGGTLPVARSLPYLVDQCEKWLRGMLGDKQLGLVVSEALSTAEIILGGDGSAVTLHVDTYKAYPKTIAAICDVLGFGGVKYDSHNWAKGMAWSRPVDAARRHLNQHIDGAFLDDESGFPHVAHACCNLLFTYTYIIEGIGHDDRLDLCKVILDAKQQK